jgi:hypothetical protein
VQLVGLAWLRPEAGVRSPLAAITAGALALMLVANILSVIAEAGFAWHLPDNPVTYLLFKGG